METELEIPANSRQEARECNVAALRDAAKALVDAVRAADLCDYARYDESWCGECGYAPMCVAANRCEEALKSPPRQCDVGTAEDQSRRYNAYCYNHRTMSRCCADCPADGKADCEFAWGQLPYAPETEAVTPMTTPNADAQVATPDEDAVWCAACATECPNRGKDSLVRCPHFSKRGST